MKKFWSAAAGNLQYAIALAAVLAFAVAAGRIILEPLAPLITLGFIALVTAMGCASGSREGRMMCIGGLVIVAMSWLIPVSRYGPGPACLAYSLGILLWFLAALRGFEKAARPFLAR